MIKKAVVTLLVLLVVLGGVGATVYVRNAPPSVPPLAADEAARSGRPYVVKLHAQWCANCVLTKDVWTDIERAYAGRVNLVVWDFTTEARTAASQAEAERLGLREVYDEFSGWTGTVLVVDGRTREVTAAVNGSREFADYQAAVDATLAGAPLPAAE